MRRFALVLAILMTLIAGCAAKRATPAAPPVPPSAPPTASPVPAPPAAPAPATPASPAPAPPAAPMPELRIVGQDLELTGVEEASSVVWSPSGRLAVVTAKSGSYLLDTSSQSLTVLSGFAPTLPPEFWSETQLMWMHDGRLQLRDLANGQDQLLHDFGSSVSHFIRPGDTHFIGNREKASAPQDYRFGTIVAGALSEAKERVLIETGYLIGATRDGEVLAVEGSQPGGPLWAFTPTGPKRKLSEGAAHFAQISADGMHALWLTGPAARSATVPDAGRPYDPPLTDLWTWDGAGAPVRIPLGGTFSVRAAFSPDGSRIALAINEEFLGDPGAPKPGRLAVLEDGKLRTLATFDDWVGLGMWLGGDGFRFMPPAREKTGGQSPISRIDLTGKQEQLKGLWYEAGLWQQAGPEAWQHLVLNWSGGLTTVHWHDSAQVARVRFNPNDHLGNLLYTRPSAPYLPFSSSGRLWLKRIER